MNAELLKTELAHAEQAELESDDQLRNLSALIDKASTPNSELNATDCSKLVAAALALNERLRVRTKAIRSAIRTVEVDAEYAERAKASPKRKAD